MNGPVQKNVRRLTNSELLEGLHPRLEEFAKNYQELIFTLDMCLIALEGIYEGDLELTQERFLAILTSPGALTRLEAWDLEDKSDS